MAKWHDPPPEPTGGPLAPGTYTLFAQAQDGYAVFGDRAALTLTVQ